jgi:hypothetical protein
MKPSVLFVVVVMGLCGYVALDQPPDSSYEGVVKDMLTTVEQITKTLQTVKDRESADAARPELKKAAHKMLDLRKKAEEWKQPSKDEKDRLQKEYAPKFEVAVKQLQKLAVVVKSVPGGEEAVAELAILKDRYDNEKDKEKDKVKKDK